jgi:hypothetical protein
VREGGANGGLKRVRGSGAGGVEQALELAEGAAASLRRGGEAGGGFYRSGV